MKVYVLISDENDWPEIVAVYASRELATQVGERLKAEHIALGADPRWASSTYVEECELLEEDDPPVARMVRIWHAHMDTDGRTRQPVHSYRLRWRPEFGPTESAFFRNNEVIGRSAISADEAIRLARQALEEQEHKALDSTPTKA